MIAERCLADSHERSALPFHGRPAVAALSPISAVSRHVRLAGSACISGFPSNAIATRSPRRLTLTSTQKLLARYPLTRICFADSEVSIQPFMHCVPLAWLLLDVHEKFPVNKFTYTGPNVLTLSFAVMTRWKFLLDPAEPTSTRAFKSEATRPEKSQLSRLRHN